MNDEREWQDVRNETEVRNYVFCPHCGKGRFYYDYMRQAVPSISECGPTYCDECHRSYYVRLLPDGGIQTAKSHHTKQPILVLLARSDMLLVVEHSRLDGCTDENLAYYFNEHTCPRNYFRDTDRVLLRPDNADPHGLFRFIATAEPRDLTNTSYEEVLEHFGVTEDGITVKELGDE